MLVRVYPILPYLQKQICCQKFSLDHYQVLFLMVSQPSNLFFKQTFVDINVKKKKIKNLCSIYHKKILNIKNFKDQISYKVCFGRNFPWDSHKCEGKKGTVTVTLLIQWLFIANTVADFVILQRDPSWKCSKIVIPTPTGLAMLGFCVEETGNWGFPCTKIINNNNPLLSGQWSQ